APRSCSNARLAARSSVMAEELSIVRKPALVPAPTLRDIAAVLFRQRRLWTISFGMVLLAVILYGIFAPSYQAEMKVMIRRGRLRSCDGTDAHPNAAVCRPADFRR